MTTMVKKRVTRETEVVEREIEALAGTNGIAVWRYVNEREVNKKFGKAGAILHRPEEIAAALGMSFPDVWEALYRLCFMKRYLRHYNGMVSAW